MLFSRSTTQAVSSTTNVPFTLRVKKFISAGVFFFSLGFGSVRFCRGRQRRSSGRAFLSAILLFSAARASPIPACRPTAPASTPGVRPPASGVRRPPRARSRPGLRPRSATPSTQGARIASASSPPTRRRPNYPRPLAKRQWMPAAGRLYRPPPMASRGPTPAVIPSFARTLSSGSARADRTAEKTGRRESA